MLIASQRLAYSFDSPSNVVQPHKSGGLVAGAYIVYANLRLEAVPVVPPKLAGHTGVRPSSYLQVHKLRWVYVIRHVSGKRGIRLNPRSRAWFTAGRAWLANQWSGSWKIMHKL